MTAHRPLPLSSRTGAPSKTAASVRSPAGFTLIEVILATAVSAVVLVVIQTVFFGALRLRTTTSDRIEADLALHRTLEIVQRDLRGIMLPGGTLSGELQTSLNLSLSSNVAGERIGPDFYCDTGRIDAWSPFADVQRVAYYLAPTSGGGNTFELVRSVSRNLLPALAESSEEQTLLGRIAHAGFEFFDGSGWTPDWDSAVTATLPTAIRFSIQLVASEANGQAGQPIELVVPVFVTSPGSVTPSLAAASP